MKTAISLVVLALAAFGGGYVVPAEDDVAKVRRAEAAYADAVTRREAALVAYNQAADVARKAESELQERVTAMKKRHGCEVCIYVPGPVLITP